MNERPPNAQGESKNRPVEKEEIAGWDRLAGEINEGFRVAIESSGVSPEDSEIDWVLVVQANLDRFRKDLQGLDKEVRGGLLSGRSIRVAAREDMRQLEAMRVKIPGGRSIVAVAVRLADIAELGEEDNKRRVALDAQSQDALLRALKVDSEGRGADGLISRAKTDEMAGSNGETGLKIDRGSGSASLILKGADGSLFDAVIISGPDLGKSGVDRSIVGYIDVGRLANGLI